MSGFLVGHVMAMHVVTHTLAIIYMNHLAATMREPNVSKGIA